jgi:hypothetical protein
MSQSASQEAFPCSSGTANENVLSSVDERAISHLCDLIFGQVSFFSERDFFDGGREAELAELQEELGLILSAILLFCFCQLGNQYMAFGMLMDR